MAKSRPLSPHLQVYRPQLTSVMSIMHRVTGVILATGTIFLAFWLTALAVGSNLFTLVAAALSHPIGQLVLFGYSLALVYHSLNGVRHLSWDLGIGLGIKEVYITGYLTVGTTVMVTLVLWFVV